MTPFLGIDIGATWIKSAVLGLDSGIVSEVNRVPFPPFLPGRPDGHCEVAPDVVVALVWGEIYRLRRIVPRPGGIMICGQMHGVVMWRDGRAVSPFYSPWDRRTASRGPGSCEELRALGTPGEWRNTGNELRPGIGLATLYWLKRHGALPFEGAPITIADFVAASLARADPILHPTHAAGLGAWGVEDGDWHPVRGLVETDATAWPPVHDCSAFGIVGDHDGIPVWCAVGDHQCALLGAGLRPGDLSVNVGTGAQVAVLIDRPDPGDAQVRPWFDDRTRLRTVTHLREGPDDGLIGRIHEAAGRLGVPWTRVVASGGLLRARPDLCDALRERFAPAVFVPPRDTDETLLGLLALARRWTA